MSDKSLIDAIRHYQKDIERCPENKERMLRCIKRLYVMPIKVEHLQMTGVGRSVNNLREIAGEVGDAATALVAKWKAMVTAEDMDRQSEEEGSVVEEDEEIDLNVEDVKANGRISPDKFEDEHSIREKENIRVNHRTDKPKSEKSEHTSRHSEKHLDKPSKDNKSSKHSSKAQEKEREHSSRKESSSSKHISSSSKDKKEKEKHSSSSKSEHKSSSDQNKSKHKSDKHSKDKSIDKHSSKDKDSKDKHSNKHSSKDRHKDKDRSSSSKDKDKKDQPKEDRDKIKREKRSKSLEREKDSRKSEKRKHRSKDRDEKHETPVKKMKHIKQERVSSEDEEDDRESMEHSENEEMSNDNSGSDESENSECERSNDDRSGSEEEFDDESDSEPYKRVQVKQEPLSDSESEKNSKRKSSSHRDSSHKSSKHHTSKHREHRSEDMKPPSLSRSDSSLKALIKENEKKIKKEKTDEGNDKTKKSKVKLEMNQDGSIDSGSGASFADALMGFDVGTDSAKKKKKKKDRLSGEGSSKMSSVSSTSGSHHSGRSRSPSVGSTTSSHTASPSKPSRKHSELPSETPEALLKKPIKLEPLSLDISSTLPEISTNYKPLPSIQSRHTPQQTMSEEQMFSHMTSKNQRTKVYSGYKYGHTATVPSLYSFCIQVLYDNIDGLEYTGGVPFEILKPLLIKLNAEQLLNLEHYNPYLVTDTDDLWKFHCNKTFAKAKRDDLETWRETYLRFMDERELKLKRLTANISESMAKSGPVRQAKLAYVDTVAKPPRNIARKQARYGTGASTSASTCSSSVSSSSSTNISQVAAAQNQAKKKEIVSKAIVGGFTPATPATEPVPAFNNPATAAKILKKKKAPLMAKALQLIKSNSRYKR